MALLANINRDDKKRPQPFTIDDFMVRFGDDVPPAPPKKTWQEMKQVMEAYYS